MCQSLHTSHRVMLSPKMLFLETCKLQKFLTKLDLDISLGNVKWNTASS